MRFLALACFLTLTLGAQAQLVTVTSSGSLNLYNSAGVLQKSVSLSSTGIASANDLAVIGNNIYISGTNSVLDTYNTLTGVVTSSTSFGNNIVGIGVTVGTHLNVETFSQSSEYSYIGYLDTTTGTYYRNDGSFFTEGSPAGFAANTNYYYTVDNGYLQERTYSDGEVNQSYPQMHASGDIASDGTNVFVVDNSDSSLQEFNSSAGLITSHFLTTPGYITNVYDAGEDLYVTTTAGVYEYNAQTGASLGEVLTGTGFADTAYDAALAAPEAPSWVLAGVVLSFVAYLRRRSFGETLAVSL